MQSKISILRSLDLIYTNPGNILALRDERACLRSVVPSARTQVFQGHLVAELVLVLENRREKMSAPRCLKAVSSKAIMPDWGFNWKKSDGEEFESEINRKSWL